MPYPAALDELIQLFELLPEAERREMLIHESEQAESFRRRAGESYDVEDVRKDEQCTDTVGVFLKVTSGQKVEFAIELGPKVQTLTKAMTVILCKGLNGSTLEDILEVPPDFVPRIIGAHLVRLRSQTVYYVLDRMKEAAGVFKER
ncbi:cysteine desulfuration protein SufE [Prosthecobacter debontii]|uniref:Cysteine desulfuration protein SufE n=1 Tax=Prosthecobacter debontii TaxID=48467 RepID=A0A1T4YE91_9BACT|nr:SufE family protein [Prosthecobacter debontii]SKB00142.1 cysteine desulfuration protein SufE [Prosthecobacter debontii]